MRIVRSNATFVFSFTTALYFVRSFHLHYPIFILFQIHDLHSVSIGPSDFFKVHIFWERHKILQNLHLTYVVPVKSKVKISQNFVVCSEYMNFKTIESDTELTKLSFENIKNWPFLEKISSIMFQVNSKKCQIIFKTLIISGFQWMHWCAQKTSTETSN